MLDCWAASVDLHDQVLCTQGLEQQLDLTCYSLHAGDAPTFWLRFYLPNMAEWAWNLQHLHHHLLQPSGNGNVSLSAILYDNGVDLEYVAYTGHIFALAHPWRLVHNPVTLRVHPRQLSFNDRTWQQSYRLPTAVLIPQSSLGLIASQRVDGGAAMQYGLSTTLKASLASKQTSSLLLARLMN